MTNKLLDRQSIFDIAIQEFGGIEAVLDMAELNDLSITDDLITGDELNLFGINITDKVLQEYYSVNKLLPATSITTEELCVITGNGDGIEYWCIEYDFIIS